MLSDVTLNDFANSTVTKNRLKKSTNNVNRVLQHFEDEKSWEDKSDDFEGDFVKQENDGGNYMYVIRKPELKKRKKRFSLTKHLNESGGNDYPIDLWYILSEYIRPEDVGRFAGICRSSFEVVCTAKFWFHLYRKYYNITPSLPEQLQPECLVRKYGLRAAVIRSLYYMYPHFVSKLKLNSCNVVFQHPDILKNRVCDSMWYCQRDGWWRYSFKLRETINNSKQLCRITNFKRHDLLEFLDDVSANPDEHCRVLQITSKHFIHVPPLIGKSNCFYFTIGRIAFIFSPLIF